MFAWTATFFSLVAILIYTPVNRDNTFLCSLSHQYLLCGHFCPFFKNQIVYLFPNSPSSWKWSWTSDPLAPSSRGLGSQINTLCLACAAGHRTSGLNILANTLIMKLHPQSLRFCLFKNYVYYFVFVCISSSEDSFWEWDCFSYHVGPKNWTQLIKFSKEHFYPMNFLPDLLFSL